MMGLVKKNDQTVPTETIVSFEQGNLNNNCKNSVGIKERFLVRRQNPLDYYQHHHNTYTPRGRSKVSSRIKASPIEDTKDDLLIFGQTKSGRRSRIKTTTATAVSNDVADQLNGNINLELNSLGDNNNVKRSKRSLSSTRLEKEKSDEKNTKLLRKNQTNDKVQNSQLQKTATAATTATSLPIPLRKLNSNKTDYSVLKLRKR